jgi:hypothetical protein
VRLQTSATLADVRGGEADLAMIRHGTGRYPGVAAFRDWIRAEALRSGPAS